MKICKIYKYIKKIIKINNIEIYYNFKCKQIMIDNFIIHNIIKIWILKIKSKIYKDNYKINKIEIILKIIKCNIITIANFKIYKINKYLCLVIKVNFYKLINNINKIEIILKIKCNIIMDNFKINIINKIEIY